MVKHGEQVALVYILAASWAGVEMLKFVGGLTANAPTANVSQPIASRDQLFPAHHVVGHAE
jgi:hypothetical protein